MTVDPEIPVPPVTYGGIERIVDMLVRGLVDRGHEVTLFAHPDSRVPCELLPYPGPSSLSHVDTAHNAAFVSAAVLRGRYDLVHSFARLAYLLPILPLRLPKLMSYGRNIANRSVAWGDRLSMGSLDFSGCSWWQIAAWQHRSNWHVVYNAVPLRTYEPTDSVPPDAPLTFLGRIEHVKGPDLAIEVARRSGRRLIIAGNVPREPQHSAFFRREVLPHVDNDRVRYVGPVTDQQKNELLKRSLALLFPDRIDEPFGMVMAEALACGTPVIGLRRGAVSEIVDDGGTGFVCDTIGEMASRVGPVASLSRGGCRAVAEEKYGEEGMVDAYLGIYRSLLGTTGPTCRRRRISRGDAATDLKCPPSSPTSPSGKDRLD